MSKKLFLVDGSNMAFRGFFAAPPHLRAEDGMPTGAILLYIRMLLKMVDVHKPDYVLVAFDKGQSFRNELFPDYKGQRPDMPEDLRAQWPEFMPLSEAFGFKAVAPVGFEADDIIGTLAKKYGGPDVQVTIVSGDKDFCQLVNDHVSVVDLQRDKVYDRAGVIDKWGVPPERIVDLFAMMGDSSDNIPGIPGVGQKKAAQFLEQYGDLDAVLAATDIKGKTGEKIRDNADAARLAYQLVSIHTDMELDFGLDALVPGPRDDAELTARMTRYDFRSLTAELGLERGMVDDGQAVEVDPRHYRTATGAQVAPAIRKAGRVAVQLVAEGSALALCWADDAAAVVPLADAGPVWDLLAAPEVGVLGFDVKATIHALAAKGRTVTGVVGDPMLKSYVHNVDHKHELGELSRRHLRHELSPPKGPKQGDLFADPSASVDADAAEPAHVAWLLEQQITVPEPDEVYRRIEVPLVGVLARMEQRGIGVNRQLLASLSGEFGQRIDELVAEIHAEAGQEFNVNSTQQLAEILFEKRGHAPGKKTKFGYSTASPVLEDLRRSSEDPLPGLILGYRELAKLKSTYVDALPGAIAADGRIHATFQQAVAATGRLSSLDPNLQNIPIRSGEGRRIRECFVPRPGHVFLSADYSQIELRVLAHFCGEGPLVDAFKAGHDIHRRTASEMLDVPMDEVSTGQRRTAKAINFGLIYGMTSFRLARDLGLPRKRADELYDRYFERYPQVRRYMDESIRQATELGYATTLHGRRRPVLGLTSRNFNERSGAERIAMNTPIQGTAADIIKLAMIRVDARLNRDFPEAALLLQVHDELVLEVPGERLEVVRQAVVEEMVRADDLVVELVVDTGTGASWSDAH